MNITPTARIVIIVVILIAIFIVLILLSRQISVGRIHPVIITERSSSSSSSTSEESASQDSKGRGWVRAAGTIPANTETLSAPVLRCYDYFEFPKEGGFHVKTCGIPSSPSPKKLFIQWFPVDKAADYNVYLNKGSAVDTSNYQDRWTVSAGNHYFESDTLDAQGCWSMMVTALNDQQAESPASMIYTTCSE